MLISNKKHIMKKLFIILILFFFTFSSTLLAQSLNSIGKSYDKASELLVEGDTAGAIELFQKCADMSEGQGEIGACIKLTSEKKIYDLYVIEGQQAYGLKKFDAALTAYEKAGVYAEAINDPQLISQLNAHSLATYIGKAEELYNTTKYKKASEMYLEIIEMNPEYAEAYYGLLLTYSKLDEGVKMEEAEKKVQQYSTDESMKEKARVATASYYAKKSREAFLKDELNIASMMASKSLIYDNSNPEVYYDLARINNKREEWASAEKSASRAVRLSKGTMPEYYYELGVALEGAGNLEKACEAYLKVSGGEKQGQARIRASELNCE